LSEISIGRPIEVFLAWRKGVNGTGVFFVDYLSFELD